MNVRPLQPADGELLHAAIHERFAKIIRKSRKSWVTGIDLDEVFKTLMQSPDVVLLDESIVIYAVAEQPWYTTDMVLAEQLVLRIRPSSTTLNDVVDLLKRVAAVLGCKHIVVGTALSSNDKALEKLYGAHGFRREATELTLEMPNG